MPTYENHLIADWETTGHEFLVSAGYAYEKGIVVEQNFDIARNCYAVAGGAGNSQAICNLGWLYENGLGVDRDVEQAVTIYERAAKLGNTPLLW